MRTWPEPTILPSIIRSWEICDSFISRWGAAAGRRAASALSGATLLVLSGSRGAGAGAIPGLAGAAGLVPVVESFQSAMANPVLDERPKLRRCSGEGPVSPSADKIGYP